jgi:predicted nucleotidyltransferase
MSEERRKRKQAEFDEKEREELLEMGRIFGSIARSEPELWTFIERESYLTGRKKHEVLADMVARAIIEREVVAKGLTMEQLLAAWDLKDRLEKMLFNKVVLAASQMFGMLLQQVGEMVMGVRMQQEQMVQQMIEEAKKRDIEYQMRMTQAKLASTLMNAMLPMITTTLSKVVGQQVQLPQVGEQQQQVAGVDVEVIE